MFAHALGCTVLATLLATPVVVDSSGHTFCDRAVERSGVTLNATTAPRSNQALLDVEFPRRLMTVWFDKPVKVGNRILMGRYLIEHDNARMAHGRPCTYLYDADDPRLPVVAFHCRHLVRPASTRPTVIVRSVNDVIGMRELVAFQFAGEVEHMVCRQFSEPKPGWHPGNGTKRRIEENSAATGKSPHLHRPGTRGGPADGGAPID